MDKCKLLKEVLLCIFRTLAEMAAATSVHVVTIIEPIIQHADWFFPEGLVKHCIYPEHYLASIAL